MKMSFIEVCEPGKDWGTNEWEGGRLMEHELMMIEMRDDVWALDDDVLWSTVLDVTPFWRSVKMAISIFGTPISASFIDFILSLLARQHQHFGILSNYLQRSCIQRKQCFFITFISISILNSLVVHFLHISMYIFLTKSKSNWAWIHTCSYRPRGALVFPVCVCWHWIGQSLFGGLGFGQ